MDFINQVIEFFQYIIDFIETGSYEYFTQLFAKFVIYYTIAMIKFKIFMLGFAWDVAQQILLQLNISSYINSAFGSLDSTILNVVVFFKIPEFINIISTALVTRYVMSFVGL